MHLRLLSILIGLSLSHSALANVGSWYQFEIILFKFTNTANTDTESWPDKPGLPSYDNLLSTLTDKQNSSRPEARSTQTSNQFRLLKPEQLILKKEARAISLSRSRKLLLHTGWMQAMQSQEKAKPLAIQLGKTFTTLIPDPNAPVQITDTETASDTDTSQNQVDTTDNTTSEQNPEANTIESGLQNETGEDLPEGAVSIPTTPMIPVKLIELEGTIKLTISRYLHLWTDLVLRHPSSGPTTLSQNPVVDNSEYAQAVPVKTFRYIDHRRMRSRELHYIDNPSFGILIYGRPYKAESTSE